MKFLSCTAPWDLRELVSWSCYASTPRLGKTQLMRKSNFKKKLYKILFINYSIIHDQFNDLICLHFSTLRFNVNVEVSANISADNQELWQHILLIEIFHKHKALLILKRLLRRYILCQLSTTKVETLKLNLLASKSLVKLFSLTQVDSSTN